MRVVVRQRLEQDRVDDAEDGRVRANAERERNDRDGGEARALEEHSDAETNILKQRFHVI